ncbi:MAG: FtsQ-type POTRA domain-containing protein [Anaerolineae bacterium]|nr:FtsQ-type POTRA domain-containing protein [Anaerolineae bacterium]
MSTNGHEGGKGTPTARKRQPGRAHLTEAGPSGEAGTAPAQPKANASRRVVMPRTTAYEQRTAVPKMRVGPGRQRTLHVETRPVTPPRQIRLPRPRLGELTPARMTSLLLVATGLALTLFLLAANGFYVYSADIQGNHLVSPQDIYARSGVDGQNVFMLRSTDAERRLRDVPFIKRARVSLGLPAQVTIEVEERTPVALWQVGGAVYGVAEDGTVLPADGAPPGAPLVQAEGNPLPFGSKLDAGWIALARHLRDLVPDTKGLIFSTERGIGIVTSQGWPVYFGSQDEATAARLSVLSSLTAELKQQKVEPEFIDLRYAARPYYRLKSSNR